MLPGGTGVPPVMLRGGTGVPPVVLRGGTGVPPVMLKHEHDAHATNFINQVHQGVHQ